jgi:predicted O-methyltransferase YrrM
MEFTKDWFTYHIPAWKDFLDKLQPKRAIEIGSYEGRSACWLIENYPKLVTLYCIDPWMDEDIESRFDANIAEAEKTSGVSVEKIKSRSAPALIELARHQPSAFDFIYIDGSHTAPDVLTDAVLALQLIKVGGIIAFDDYLWLDDSTGGRDVLEVPKLAVDAFVNIYHKQVRVVRYAPLYQLYVQRTQ